MRRAIPFLLLLACSRAPAPAATKTAAASLDWDVARMTTLARGKPDKSDYPQADAVVALDRDDITLQKDGTVVEKHHSIVKILDAQRGKEKFADVHVQFDTKRQTLVIDTARTITADGTAHATSPEEITDIVPQKLADATIYSDVRERVVSFPAVDTNTVVELAWTRTTRPGPDASLGGEQLLATWDPVLARVVTITAPEGTKPQLAALRSDLVGTESSDATAGTHTWTYRADNLPDRHEELGSPVEAAVLPRLVYGFQPGWREASRAVAVRYLGAVVETATPEAVKAEAQKLVAGAKTDVARAAALFKFVAHDIRSIDLPLGWAGYAPHAPDVVLANRYGDDRDKVALLLALCEATGIHGVPVLARSGDVPVATNVPTPAQFDRMIARLTLDGKEVWLDPSDEHGQFGDAFVGEDNLVLPLDRAGAEPVKRPLLDPAASLSHTTETLALTPTGDLDAKYDYELSGWFARRASEALRPLKGEHVVQFFQHAATALAAGALDKGHQVGDTLSVTDPIHLTQHVAAPGYSEQQGDFRVLELPSLTLDVAEDDPPAGLAVRKDPLALGPPRTQRSDVTVTVPDGWKVAWVPLALKGAVDGMRWDDGCAVTGRTITCHREVTFDEVRLPVEKYAAFHDAVTKLRAYERRIVLLTRAG